jgi:DNA repair photolyase
MFGFVSHTHSHIGGECPHACSYCYVGRMPWGRPEKYCGPIRLVEKELSVKYGEGNTVFVENCSDLFAETIPNGMIVRVLEHCCLYPKNTYLFHTKNPARYADYLCQMPPDRVLGATAETNRPTQGISHAPAPLDRLAAMAGLSGRKLVTIEPILEFDLDEFVAALIRARPDHIIVGADSKCRGLKEPSKTELLALLDTLRLTAIDLRLKPNLERLLR